MFDVADQLERMIGGLFRGEGVQLIVGGHGDAEVARRVEEETGVVGRGHTEYGVGEFFADQLCHLAEWSAVGGLIGVAEIQVGVQVDDRG